VQALNSAMMAGLTPNIEPKLTDDEEDLYERCFVYLSISPSEFEALPDEEKPAIAAFMQHWHLVKHYQSRTVAKKQ
jgi:hypothetical protein